MDPALDQPAARPLCVLKFGGSVLTAKADYAPRALKPTAMCAPARQ